MKTKIRIISIVASVLFVLTLNAQIKIHDDNWISLASLSFGSGVQIAPNGVIHYQPDNYDNYGNLNIMYAPKSTSKSYIVYYNSAHKFFVYGSGQVYAGGTWVGSDFSLKKDITPISNSLDKLSTLQGVSYRLKDSEETTTSDTYAEDISPDVIAQLNEEKSRKTIGLIAQDVEAIFPEAVRTMTDGTKAVNYDQFVGILIEAVKELNLKVTENAELKNEIELLNSKLDNLINDCCETTQFYKNSNPNQTGSGSDIGGAKLYQNNPNPFDENTVIKCDLPNTIGNAILCLYDLNGRQKKMITISERGTVLLKINDSELIPGMYFYSLIVDNQEIDTKKLILTD